MKVRFGIATGAGADDPERLGRLAADVADLGFDSLWLPEVLAAPIPDPVAALAFVAGRAPGLKIGTQAILCGRNPVRLARQLASLDRLSGGRLLVIGVTGLTTPAERSALGSARPGADLEETLPLLRRLWAGETVTHHGEFHHLDEVHAGVTPVQDPLEVWLGGMSDKLLDRCGRLGDGWLPGLCTPERGAAAIARIQDAAAAADRHVDPEHFGVNLPYAWEPLVGPALAALERRAKGQPIADLVPVGRDGIRRAVERYVEQGLSKFVLRPSAPAADPTAELERVAAVVGDLQT